MRLLFIKMLIGINFLFLIGHLVLERFTGDLNALRIGSRSHVSQMYILAEGVSALMLFLFVFGYFYPDMRKMFSSKLTFVSGGLVAVEVAIWILYR